MLIEVSSSASEAVVSHREAEVRAARDAGGTPDQILARVQAARAKVDAPGGLIDQVNAIISARDAYLDALTLAASKDDPNWSTLQTPLRSGVLAYETLSLSLSLPKIPPIVTQMIKE